MNLRSRTGEPPQALNDVKFIRSLLLGYLPLWSRSAWWAAFSRRALHLLFCAPVTITRLVRTALPLRCYGIMCSVFLAGNILLLSSRGSCCVLIILGGGLTYTYGRCVLPPLPLGHGACQLVHGGSELFDVLRMPVYL